MTAIRFNQPSAPLPWRTTADPESDLSHLADIWWGDGEAAGIARRRAQRRFVLAVTVASLAIASVTGLAAEPSEATPGAIASPIPPAPAAVPIAAEPTTIPPPADYAIEMMLALSPGQSLEVLLVKAGAAAEDARTAATLVRGEAFDDGGPLVLFLGDRSADGSRPIEQLSMRPAFDRQVAVSRQGPGAFKLIRREIAVDATPLRISGAVGSGLFWSLRAAGAGPQVAEDFLAAMAERGATAAPGDRFDLVVDRRRAATGEIEPGALQYAGLKRARGGDVSLVRWTVGQRRAWVDPERPVVSASAPALPLGGRISSPFGMRTHPIFRTARFHRGVDIRAAWGTPVHASADGQVVTSGWSGGYGLRVRLAHRDGIATSFSHLSRITVPIGADVRQGDLIGYVGSTGFSTGAHLHFEMFRDGQAVDPLGTNIASSVALSRFDRAALAARIAQLRSVPAA